MARRMILMSVSPVLPMQLQKPIVECVQALAGKAVC